MNKNLSLLGPKKRETGEWLSKTLNNRKKLSIKDHREHDSGIIPDTIHKHHPAQKAACKELILIVGLNRNFAWPSLCKQTFTCSSHCWTVFPIRRRCEYPMKPNGSGWLPFKICDPTLLQVLEIF
jgi:hypothetical protein